MISLQILSVLAIFIGHGIYIYSIYKKEATPHLFSWLNWSLIAAIGAFAQFGVDGGDSTWVIVTDALICFFIAILSLFIGEKNITKSDWVAFIGALIAVPVWQLTNSPINALIVIIFIDTLSYYPTIRKSWNRPYSEPTNSYFWSGLGYLFALFIIADISVSNLIYPAFLVFTAWGFVIYLIIRRKLVAKK